MPEMNISLPPEAMAVIAKAVEGGKYASSSDVVAEALRVWSEEQAVALSEREPPFAVKSMEELRAKLEEARLDPRPSLPMEEVMDELEAYFVNRHSVAHAR